MKLPVVIGFDAEWVDGSHVAATLEPGKANRVLSYQLYLLDPNTGHGSSRFVELKSARKASRHNLASLLQASIDKALKEGVINATPTQIVLAAHFSRADLSTLRDFPWLKRKLSSVRKTYATTKRPIVLELRHGHTVSVRVVDTMLLSPNGSALAALGEALGLPKVELPSGFAKDRMDLFLAADPAAFRRYAMTDAEIAARWAKRVLIDIIRDELGVKRWLPTLGAVAVDLIRKEAKACDVEMNAFLGLQKGRESGAQPLPALVGKWEFAAQCYHGGRNEAFAVGYSPDGQEVYDLDIKSAYTTALAMILVPDWSSARYTAELSDLAVVDAAMTFAHVRFRFPDDTAYPSLPVRASRDRGLVYVLEGETFCTGAELVVAMSQGASLAVLQGLRVDWLPGSPRVFEAFTRKINSLRTAAKQRGDAVHDKVIKEIGNSGYGKLAQAVSSMKTVGDDASRKRVFNTVSEENEDLGASGITQPMMAAFTTGIVRAALSEALARAPADAWIGSATTDGFLSSLPLEQVNLSGQVAQAFCVARHRIFGEAG